MDMEELELTYARNVKWEKHFIKESGIFLESLHLPALQGSCTISNIFPRGKYSIHPYKDLYVNVHSIFVIAQNWKEPKYPLIG